jgi:hypothetical protein
MRELKTKFVSNSGTAILLAVLVMSTILTAALATSKLVLNEVTQSTQIDHSMIAFYAAESALEKGLFQVRQKDLSVSTVDQTHEVFNNDAAYTLTAKDTENVLYTSLAPNESYQIDLFNPNSLADLTNPIKAIGVDFTGNSWLEVKWVSWLTNGEINPPESLSLTENDSKYVQLLTNNVYLYRVRFINSGLNQLNNIIIKAYNDVDPVANCPILTECQVPIPARVSLDAVGRFPDNSNEPSQQRIYVTMPEKSPISGLYDYVLYSEESIVKEN